MPKPVSTRPQTQVIPDPAMEKSSRRTLSSEYTIRMLEQAAGCRPSALRALLHREKLYNKQLAQWRKELALDTVARLAKSQPGPQANKSAA